MLPSAKMIYPDPKIADAILGKTRAAHPNDKREVVRLPTGFQVCKVTKLPDDMPPAKATPVVKPKLSNKLLPEEEAIQAHRVKCKRLHSPIWEADRHRTSRPVRSKSRRPDFPA